MGKKVLIVLAVFMAMCLFVMPVQAAGIYVDDDDDCEETNREDNKLASLNDASVWLNISPNVSKSVVDDYTWTLTQKGTVVCQCTANCFNFDQCDSPLDNFRSSDIRGTSGGCPSSGTVSFKVFDENGNNVGGDTFRIAP